MSISACADMLHCVGKRPKTQSQHQKITDQQTTN